LLVTFRECENRPTRCRLIDASGKIIGASSRHFGAEIDPDRVLLLDANRSNNSRLVDAPAASTATRWSLTWLVWLQDQLLTYGFFV
jgi:hypothetical protein